MISSDVNKKISDIIDGSDLTPEEKEVIRQFRIILIAGIRYESLIDNVLYGSSTKGFARYKENYTIRDVWDRLNTNRIVIKRGKHRLVFFTSHTIHRRKNFDIPEPNDERIIEDRYIPLSIAICQATILQLKAIEIMFTDVILKDTGICFDEKGLPKIKNVEEEFRNNETIKKIWEDIWSLKEEHELFKSVFSPDIDRHIVIFLIGMQDHTKELIEEIEKLIQQLKENKKCTESCLSTI